MRWQQTSVSNTNATVSGYSWTSTYVLCVQEKKENTPSDAQNELDYVHQNYEIIEVFHPSLNSSEAMSDYITVMGFDDFWYESMFTSDKKYYLEWRDSDHERDSSGDRLTVWKRNEQK